MTRYRKRYATVHQELRYIQDITKKSLKKKRTGATEQREDRASERTEARRNSL